MRPAGTTYVPCEEYAILAGSANPAWNVEPDHIPKWDIVAPEGTSNVIVVAVRVLFAPLAAFHAIVLRAYAGDPPDSSFAPVSPGSPVCRLMLVPLIKSSCAFRIAIVAPI